MSVGNAGGTSGAAPGNPSRLRVWRHIGLAGSILAGTGFFFSMSEMAALLDGPGIGLFEGRIAGLVGSGAVWIAGAVVFLVGSFGHRSLRWAGTTFLLGVLAYFLLLLSGVGGRIYGYAYARRCDNNSIHDCYAAGSAYRYGQGRTQGEHQTGDQFFIKGCELGTLPHQRATRGWSENSCRRLLENDEVDDGLRARACKAFQAICTSSCTGLDDLGCTTGAKPTAARHDTPDGTSPTISARDVIIAFGPVGIIVVGLIGFWLFRRHPHRSAPVRFAAVAALWAALCALLFAPMVKVGDLTPMVACRGKEGALRLVAATAAPQAACTPVHPSREDLALLWKDRVLIGKLADSPEIARRVAEMQTPLPGFDADAELMRLQTTSLLVSGSHGLVSHQYRIVDGKIRDARAWSLSPRLPDSFSSLLAVVMLIILTIDVGFAAWQSKAQAHAKPWMRTALVTLALVALAILFVQRRMSLAASTNSIFDPFDDAGFNSDVWLAWSERSDGWPWYQGELAPRAYMLEDLSRLLMKERPTNEAVVRMLGLPSWRRDRKTHGSEVYFYNACIWQQIDGPVLAVEFDKNGRVVSAERLDFPPSPHESGYARPMSFEEDVEAEDGDGGGADTGD